ncbi:unnamed protein product, partial [Ectocarpus fasciculatus]
VVQPRKKQQRSPPSREERLKRLSKEHEALWEEDRVELAKANKEYLAAEQAWQSETRKLSELEQKAKRLGDRPDVKRAHLQYSSRKAEEVKVQAHHKRTKAEMAEMAEKMRLSLEAVEQVQKSRAKALHTYTEAMKAHGGGGLNKEIKDTLAACKSLEKEKDFRHIEVVAKRDRSEKSRHTLISSQQQADTLSLPKKLTPMQLAERDRELSA